MPLLCVVSSDIDCIILPDNPCKKCVEQKLNLKILHTYTITSEFLNEKETKVIKGYNIKCRCKN
jgi:hypothetical protein